MVTMMTGKWKYFAKRKYAISSDGKIISQKTNDEINPIQDRSGFNWVYLVHKRKRKKFRVDKLVLHFFNGSEINTPYPIIHLDGNNSNDSLLNLKIQFPEKLKKPKNHSNSKLDESQVLEIVDLLKKGYSSRKIGDIYNRSGTLIDNINKGLSWKYLTWPITESYPIRDKIKINNRQGEKCNFSKLNEEKVRKIKVLLKNRHTAISIAKRFKVSVSTISKIKSGKNWAHIKENQ